MSHAPWSACLCMLRTSLSHAKTAERTEMPWAADSRGLKEPCIRFGAHWHHLANTIKRSARCDDDCQRPVTLIFELDAEKVLACQISTSKVV